MQKNKKDCPCKGCTDRNAYCHMKGRCPHGYTEWREEHIAEIKQMHENEDKYKKTFTAAQEKRHFNYIKKGQGNTKR